MKLYWRYKKDGKWTWQAATVNREALGTVTVDAFGWKNDCLLEEEE